MIFNIFITVFLVLLNGFFVAAEFALVKVRMSQIELLARSGSRMARLTRNLITHLDEYLSATQLGITLASLGLGWIGEPVVAEAIIDVLSWLSITIPADYAHQLALPVAFVLITIMHIVFGELAPKTMAIQKPERVSLYVSYPLKAFYIVFKPFIWLLNSIANRFVRMLGFHSISEEQSLHSAEELRFLIVESSKSGAIEPDERQLIENVFDFADTPIKQVMVPRRNIVALEINSDVRSAILKFKAEGYSRLPVFDGSIDNIIGVLFAKDLLGIDIEQSLPVRSYTRAPHFTSEGEMISSLLQEMRRKKVHFAVVSDEFGGTAGIVTLEDIIEEIVGEIQDEYDNETPAAVRHEDGSFTVKAHSAIADLNDYLPVPLEGGEDYETLGGMISSMTGRIPEINEIIETDKYLITVLSRTKRTLETLKISLKENDEINDEEI